MLGFLALPTSLWDDIQWMQLLAVFLNQKVNTRVKTMSHFFVTSILGLGSSPESRYCTKDNLKRWIICTYSILVVSFNEALLKMFN